MAYSGYGGGSYGGGGYSNYLQAAQMGFQAGSTMSQTRWARSEVKSQENMARYNANLAARDAKIAGQESLFNQMLVTREGVRVEGAIQVAQAASGARSDVGTAVLVREHQRAETELAKDIIAYQFAVKAQHLQSIEQGWWMQVRILKQKGKQVKKMGKLQTVGGLLGGGSQMNFGG